MGSGIAPIRPVSRSAPASGGRCWLEGLGRAGAMPELVAEGFGGTASTPPGEIVRVEVGRASFATAVCGDGPALLLVHGFPLDRSLWEHQVATLSGWRRIAPDLRGFGATVAPDEGHSIATYTDDLIGLLNRLGISRAVVAGLSMGGYIAFDMVRRFPERVAGLLLCDTRADADGPEARRSRDALITLAQSHGAGAVAERLLPRVLGRTTHATRPHEVELASGMMCRAPVAGVVSALCAMKERRDSTPLLPSIAVPTLVVVGEEDEMTPPAIGRAMADAIPSAAMTIIPGAGHLSPLEVPSAVSRVLGEFLGGMRDAMT
jgi:3-oxoadipate enol-lactonase